jgi:hypothetical protein
MGRYKGRQMPTTKQRNDRARMAKHRMGSRGPFMRLALGQGLPGRARAARTIALLGCCAAILTSDEPQSFWHWPEVPCPGDQFTHYELAQETEVCTTDYRYGFTVLPRLIILDDERTLSI